jgi:Family of unknown function (DUF6519)
VSFDNSRFPFNPFNDYSAVVMEQGRVQLDSDWNEWLAEIARRIQAGTLDIMGHAAYPATTPYAFQIFASSSGGSNTISIGVGRMYVDGLLAENHGDPMAAVWDTSLAELSGSPQPPPGSPVTIDFTKQPYSPGATVPTTSGQYVAYLDVWIRPVTYLEDPKLVDVAVGVDTSGRLQTVWQVKLLPVPSGSTWSCGTPDSDLGLPISSGQLTNGTVTSGPVGPCCLTTGTGYTGVENQFYRVEIHNPGASGGANATFKWSRENASVQTGVTAIVNGANSLGSPASVLTAMSLGRDQVLGFNPGNWIEITNDTLQLNCHSGELYQIDSVDVSSKTITLTSLLSGSFPATTLTDNKNTRIIRWDQSGKIYKSDNTLYYDLDVVTGGVPNGFNGIPVPADGSTLVLENGITVQFGLTASTGSYLSLDFWTFSARTADGSIDSLVKALPRGIHHHYAKLSIVTLGSSTGATDCRTKWPPTGSEAGCGCCTNTVGDGVESVGLYTSIQAAINALPVNGGEVCILPGNYFENVLLEKLTNVVVHGCGWQTHIYSKSLQTAVGGEAGGKSPAASGLAAVFTIIGCQHIQLREFFVHAADSEVGILLDRSLDTWKQPAGNVTRDVSVAPYRVPGTSDTDVTIKELTVTASTLPAILADSVIRLRIAENRIAMKNVVSLWAAVYMSGDELIFERNWVGLGSREDFTIAPEPTGNDVPAGDVNGATPPTPAKSPGKTMDVKVNLATDLIARTPGGIHIAGPSRDVLVLENEIVGGQRNGITLGNFILLNSDGVDTGQPTGVLIDPEGDCSPGGSSEIPGTTSGSNPTRIAAGGLIRNLHISRNRIHHMGMCGIGPAGFFNLKTTLEVISLVNVSITENIISRTLMRAVGGPYESASGFAHGVICIPDVENLMIRDNIITDYGVIPGAQVCGIFVLHGQMVEISRNQIKETRDWQQAPAGVLQTAGGLQAGILLMMVTAPTMDTSNAGSPWMKAISSQNIDWGTESGFGTKPAAPIYEPGMPALRIQENVVRVALGLALEAAGYGQFAIIGNHFSSGGTVSVSPDILRTFDLKQSQAASNKTRVAGALTIAILNLGLAIEDSNPGFGYAGLYGSKSANLNHEVNLANSSNGAVLFTNNVCQLEAWVSGVEGFASVEILSLDHVLFANNQLWLDGPTLTAFLDAMILGFTTQACANRLQESKKYPVLASGLTFGFANITSQNICTYCLNATALPNQLVDSQNLILIPALCPNQRMGTVKGG